MDKRREELTLAWLKKADNDLKNVENNFKSEDECLPTDTMCFHCQQAVEKYLKAYLVSRRKTFPFGHNLADLVKKCLEVDESFVEILELAESLTPFAVEIRYPDDCLMPSLAETKEYYKIALNIKRFVKDRM